MHQNVDASVVIGFKDWGLERLLLSIGTIQASFGRYVGQVIVSDFGSQNGREVQASVEAVGAKYVRTETDGTWSRSRAINAGLAHAQGEVLISTDADMIFSPKAIETIIERILDSPHESIVLQCRDLPSKYSHDAIDPNILDWGDFELSSKLRPRWGMGGMFAASRQTIQEVRGYDSRMHTYGGEDLDFATRVRRTGSPLTWIDESHVRMFHVWHPSTRTAVDKTEAGTAAISHNREIFHNDKTFVRNIEFGSFSLPVSHPMCTVVMAVTESSEYLQESLWSVLNQSFKDFELVIVDSSGDAKVSRLLSEVDDSRLRVKRTNALTKYACLNEAVELSRGIYTVIHDEWSFMAPTRLVEQFRALNQGFVGTYGGTIRVDCRTGELEAVDNGWFGRSPLDELDEADTELSLMIRTNILRKVPFDEDCDETAGSRFIDRLSRAGVALNHTGWYHSMRLNFDVERTEEDLERRASLRLLAKARRELVQPTPMSDSDLKPPALRPKQNLEAFALRILPSQFARRWGRVTLPKSVNGDSLLKQLDSPGHTVRILSPDGTVRLDQLLLDDVSTRDLAIIQSANAEVDFVSVRNEVDSVDTFSTRELLQETLVRHIETLTDEFFAPNAQGKWIVFWWDQIPGPDMELLTDISLNTLPAVHRIIHANEETGHLFAIGSDNLKELLNLLIHCPPNLRNALAGIFAGKDDQIDKIFGISGTGRTRT